MRKKILVVDDNTVNLATIERELKDLYEVVPMISGQRAIKYLYTENVDLVLLDVEMPMKDGIQTLHEIRTLDNGVTLPVIFLTAKKPFESDDLINRIERVFKRLGMIPIEDKELLQNLQKVEANINQDQISQAIALSEEISGYQIDEEIAGRMKNIKMKLSQGDTELAINTIRRVIGVVESRMGIQHNELRNMGNRELYESLRDVERNIENFMTKEAVRTCKTVLEYNMEKKIRDNVQAILDCLMAYDDDTALSLLRKLFQELR